ncbi:MAG: hypothetical protein ACI4J4_03155 [Ruminiclostridium sp.]
MKIRRIVIIVLSLLLAAVLLIPRIIHFNDGTVIYAAPLYRVKFEGIIAESDEAAEKLPYITVEICGFEIYRD